MIGYQQIYRPAYAQMAQAPATPLAPAVASDITATQRKYAIVLGSAETLFGVASTWVGVRAGMRESGIFSVLGYVVAAGGGLFTVVNLLGTIGMIQKS